MSAQTRIKRIGVPDIRARKNGEPLVCLTAYDAPMARLLDPHCDVLLVGDSLGMVVHGLDTTIGVTLDMMILHGKAVMRGAARALVVIDLPFGTYEASPEQAFMSASRALSETGAQAVKIESGVYAGETIRFLAERGIPVMGHIGLKPQAALNEGGFKAKGRSQSERDRVIAEARAADEAGLPLSSKAWPRIWRVRSPSKSLYRQSELARRPRVTGKYSSPRTCSACSTGRRNS